MIRVETGQNMDETTLAALASGSAGPAIALFFDSVLEMRGLSQAHSDAAAGSMLEAETPTEMRADALERAFAAIDGAAKPREVKDRLSNEMIRIPARLKDAIEEAERTNGWTSASPGIRSLQLGLQGDVKAEVLRIAAGASTPRHTHRGRELTLCLMGGFSDGRGSYGPGEVSFADPDVTHTPVADDDGPCFVLAVTDAGLQLTGLLGVIQKLLGK